MKDFFIELINRNEPLFWFGLCNLLAALVCIVLTQVDSTHVLGINAWIKPLKFFLSTLIFTWSIAWYMGYLQQSTAVSIYSWMLIIVFAFENACIVYQASQGQLSHFNISTSFNALLFSLMGVAITIFTLWTGYIGYLFFINNFPELPTAYVWGIRLGILFFVIFAFEGGVMAANLAHTVGSPDGGSGLPLTNWSTQYGDLRIAHFIGMHALQILPLLSFYFIKDTKIVVFIAIVYFLLTSYLFIQALSGKPFIKF